MSVNISTRVSENNLDASAEKLDEYLVKIANGPRGAGGNPSGDKR